jgi:hypothetical protein
MIVSLLDSMNEAKDVIANWKSRLMAKGMVISWWIEICPNYQIMRQEKG